MRKIFLCIVVLILTSCNSFFIENNTPSSTYEVIRVVDGDTVVLNIDGENTKVRLIGVDTPESVAFQKDRNVKEGKVASEFTKKMLEHKKVKIEYDNEKEDRYNRKLGYLFVDDVFVNEKLLETGMAKLYVKTKNKKYFERLKKAEAYARDNKLGFWDNYFINDKNLDKIYVDSKGNALIKGNINSKGYKIYHLPSQKHYNKVKIDKSKGEKYFKTEREAQKAGFTKAGN